VGFWLILIVIYGAVTVFALYMTYQEQRRHVHQSLGINLMGYVLCTLWPLLAAVMLVLVRYHPAEAYSSESD
jgi:uncharacterized membrane protein